jgi:hypothetical protein
MLDLLKDGHIGINEVNVIARAIFNEATTMAGPEGYVVTSVNFDDLPDHVRGFIRKAVLQFTVENVLDADHSDADVEQANDLTGPSDAPQTSISFEKIVDD